jgi:mono/diheme cytochrome c family protein
VNAILCIQCHQLNPSSIYRESFPFGDSWPLNAELPNHSNPHNAISNFNPMNHQTSCVTCHQPDRAGNSCLQCHNYHVHSQLP